MIYARVCTLVIFFCILRTSHMINGMQQYSKSFYTLHTVLYIIGSTPITVAVDQSELFVVTIVSSKPQYLVAHLHNYAGQIHLLTSVEEEAYLERKTHGLRRPGIVRATISTDRGPCSSMSVIYRRISFNCTPGHSLRRL